MKRIIVLPFAEQDLKDSIEFYKQISDELKSRFISVIDSSFLDIRKNPLAFRKIKHKIRKYVVTEFPFCIFYVDESEAIYVLAVFHTKRNPGIWKKRTVSP